MKSAYRIVNTIKDSSSAGQKSFYTLQFLEYVELKDSDQPMELVKNSINLMTGQIFSDSLNMRNGKNREHYVVTKDSDYDFVSYVDFIKEICNGLSKEAMDFCFDIYSQFYNTGRAKDAYVPTMTVNLELDCSPEGYLVEYYYFQDFENLLVYDFYAAIKERRAIKKCRHCGTYFITEKRSDQIYCSEACKSETTRERSKRYYRPDDKMEMLKRRVASRLQQRTNIKNETLREARIAEHKAFIEAAKQWKKDVKAGRTTVDNYYLWLLGEDIKSKQSR